MLSAAPVPDVYTAATSVPGSPLELDTAQWAAAARAFSVNSDFDISRAIASLRRHGSLDLKGLLDVMKNESAGKRTIQALADKLILSGILENLNVAHMPTLLAARGSVSREEVGAFLNRSFKEQSSVHPQEVLEVVVKPTHLSNGLGVMSISRPTEAQWGLTINSLTDQMNSFMQQKALPAESVAMRSLKPGYIAQPRYQSSIKFANPLELRIITLWGKARMGIWWWGREGNQTHRNTWIVRRPVKPDVLSDEDCWEVLHEHTTGSNFGFEMALEVLVRDMPRMAATAEAFATAIGAPFLRVDFFVGSSRWGVRLNEVAYGCGCEYRNRTSDGQLINDAPAMARILQEGYAQRPEVQSPSVFLKKVGVHGSSYEDMSVRPVCTGLFDRSSMLGRRWADLFTNTSQEVEDVREEQVVPEELCRTTRGQPRGSPRHAAYPGSSKQAPQRLLRPVLEQRQCMRASPRGTFKGSQLYSRPMGGRQFPFVPSARGGA